MVETLEKPDVRVFQEFGPESPTLIRPTLEAAIVGESFQIETKKLAGQYFGAIVSFAYPGIRLGAAVDTSKTKAFLQQGTDEFDITAAAGVVISPSSVDLPASLIPEKTVSGQRQVSTVAGSSFIDLNADFVADGVKVGDLLRFVVSAPELIQGDSSVSTQTGDFLVLNVVSDTELEVDPVLVDEAKIEYNIDRKGTSTGDVLISYTAQRTDGVGILFEHQTTTQIENDLGAIVPENPLAYAVFLAGLHTDGVVASTMVAADSVTEHAKASEFLESKEVYGIVPLTQNPAIHQIWQQHVDQQSRPEGKKERIVLINNEIKDKEIYQTQSTTGETTATSDLFDDPNAKFLTNAVPVGARLKFAVAQTFGGTPVTEIAIKSVISETQVEVIATADATVAAIDYTVESPDFTKLQKAVNLQGIGKGFQNRRVVMVVPDIAEVSVDSTEQDVAGYFLAAAVAGLISGSSPSQGFTNFPFAGFLGLKNSNFFFNETELGAIAAGGGFIFIQETLGAPLTVRHQLTTDVTSIQRRELSIVKAVDFVSKFLRNRIRNLIGIHNITPNFLDNILTPQVNGIIQDMVEDRIIGRGTKITRLVQDELQPDTVKVDITLEVLFPANFVDFTLLI